MQSRVSANTSPHQLRWGDWEMVTAISCSKCSQMAGLIYTTSGNSSNVASLCAAVLLDHLSCVSILLEDARQETINQWPFSPNFSFT